MVLIMKKVFCVFFDEQFAIIIIKVIINVIMIFLGSFMTNINLYCEQLSKDLEMEEPIKEEAPGVFDLPIEEMVSIKINLENQGFSLFCQLADCPTENIENFYTEILDSNLYGFVTRGNVLGINNQATHLTLSRQVYYDLTYEKFFDILQDFYNMAIFWRKLALNNLKFQEL